MEKFKFYSWHFLICMLHILYQNNIFYIIKIISFNEDTPCSSYNLQQCDESTHTNSQNAYIQQVQF